MRGWPSLELQWLAFRTSSNGQGSSGAAWSPDPPGILFECPDGRLGLHIVHTRFLISQAAANLVFIASRLQLLEAFLLPSLRAQTSQRFVLYAAHDPGLPALALQPFTDALATLAAHSIVSAESEAAMALGYAELADMLEPVDPRVQRVDLFVTSRMDLDDAVHVGAVEGVQRHACAGGGGGGGGGGGIKLVYITPSGLLWYPSTKSPYGAVRAPKPSFQIYRYLAIMQSMVVSGGSLIRGCPLNVYSYPHYKPAELEKLRPARCALEFNAKRDVARWSPPDGDYGWLYTKTASSWTFGKIDQRVSSVAVATHVAALERSFGVDRAALAAANLLFAGYEAAEAMQNTTRLELER